MKREKHGGFSSARPPKSEVTDLSLARADIRVGKMSLERRLTNNKRMLILRQYGCIKLTQLKFKQNGQVLIRGSNNFNPTVSPATQALLNSLFK